MTCAKEPEPTEATRVVYRGYLRLARHTSLAADETAPTFLQALGTARDEDCPEDENGSLAAQLASAAARYGRRVRLRFVVGDDRHSADPLDPFGTGWAESKGRLEADGSLAESTAPGRWTTRESIRVGGQDLLKALRSQAGKFCHMDVWFSPVADGDKS